MTCAEAPARSCRRQPHCTRRCRICLLSATRNAATIGSSPAYASLLAAQRALPARGTTYCYAADAMMALLHRPMEFPRAPERFILPRGNVPASAYPWRRSFWRPCAVRWRLSRLRHSMDAWSAWSAWLASGRAATVGVAFAANSVRVRPPLPTSPTNRRSACHSMSLRSSARTQTAARCPTCPQGTSIANSERCCRSCTRFEAAGTTRRIGRKDRTRIGTIMGAPGRIGRGRQAECWADDPFMAGAHAA